jgi:glutamate synthase domain-containing protein 2
MQFIARLRELSGGKPTGFKLCIGHIWEWFGIVKAMLETGITPDFIVVDGAEAAPAPRRWSSPTTWARRCRKACCWCTTR